MLVRAHRRAGYCLLHALLQSGSLILLLAPGDQWEANTCGIILMGSSADLIPHQDLCKKKKQQPTIKC